MHSWKKNLVVLCGSLALSLILAEVIVRIFAPQILESHPRSLYSPDGELGFVLTPNQSGLFQAPEFQTQFATNSFGMRGADLNAKATNEYRVLVLGDSFTWGEGVEDNEGFSTQTEIKLHGMGYDNIRIVNGGVPGYGTEQERIWFQRIADQVLPDSVILAFFVGNDFADNLILEYPTVIDGFLVSSVDQSHRRNLASKLGVPPKLRIAMRTSLHLYPFLTNAWASLLNLTGSENTTEHFEMAQVHYTPRAEQALTVTSTAVQRLITACQQRGVPFGIIVIPDIRGAKSIADKHGYDVNKPARMISGVAEDMNIPILDLSPFFQNQSGAFYPMDGHWTAKGHEIAGQAIASSMRDGTLKPLLTHEQDRRTRD